MMTTEAMQTAELNDAELVTESLDGNRDAFRQIVERYQTLISSLAYCATGNMSQSEDLAQETFVSAWKQLAQLREPTKLRPWLCRITRFLISKEFRRQGREPVHAAESLEAVDEWVSPEPLPPDQVISKEEKAILWRSLERIPEIYREPLVLFYREHQSIQAVAQDLELSEDAVKQRLSRGRKLLEEQFIAFVAGALKQTSPGKTFTLGVIAALPLLATTAKAATATATATKGGAMAKATGAGAFFQAIAAWSPLLLLGGFFGFKMGGDARQSSQQRESVATFWRIMVGCLAAFVALPFLLLMVLNLLPLDFSGDFRQKVLGGMTIWLGLMYAVLPAALILWAWQRRRKFQSQTTREPEVVSDTRTKKRVVFWVVIAMVVAACPLGFSLLDTNWKVQHITAAEVQKMVADSKGKEIQFSISQYQNGISVCWVSLRENGKRAKFWAPVDDATLALLKEQGIKYPISVQGRDFEVLGWPGKFLPVFCLFILAIGVVVLLRKPGKFNPQEMDAQQTRKMEQVDKLANKVFGTGVALVLLAAVIPLVLFTCWRDRSISSVEAREIIASSKIAFCHVYQWSNGKRELWIILKDSRRSPLRIFSPNYYISPPDEPTLALLAEQGIACPTWIQGRDFGFRTPNRWVSLLCISVLIAGAAFVLRWAVKKNRTLANPSFENDSSPMKR
jgi:RNA polymerase sigma factor (sigma-70 family)